MPTRDANPVGSPCWVDLSTSDTEKAKAFYADLLGWEAEEPNAEFGGYFNFRKDGVQVAGCMAKQPDNPMPDVWSVYLTTDDAVKTIDAAAASGAQVIVPAMQVGPLGTMGVLVDPGGAFIGLWQPGEHVGFGVVAEPGAPSWFELLATDYEGSLAFYRDVFRWDTHTVSDTDEFRYTTLLHGDQWLAGVMDAKAMLPEGVPAHWSVYFGVADADDAAARCAELGGSVVMPPEDTPYGRLAALADSTGANFKIVAANDAMPAK